MLAAGNGSIINMSSVASSLRGLPCRFVYGASKAAVIGLTKSVAADYVAKGHKMQLYLPRHRGEPVLEARIAAFDDPELAEELYRGNRWDGSVRPKKSQPWRFILRVMSPSTRRARPSWLMVESL